MPAANRFPIFRSSPSAIGLLVLLGLLAAGGCKKSPEITRYQVLKEKPPAAMPSASPNESAQPKTPGQDRMLAAIVPHGDNAWFFKLAGNGAAVEKQKEAFEAFVQSITFPDTARAAPEWKSLEGWKQIDGPRPRFATLLIPADGGGKPLELTVTTLPWGAVNPSAAVLSNVNRWRNQMQLPPLEEDQLDGETSKVKLAEGEAIVANLKGTYTEGMAPRFAPPPGGTEN